MSPKWRQLESAVKTKNNHWSVKVSRKHLDGWLSLTQSRGAIAILLAANLLVGLAYLIQTNITASSGYEINTWENKVAQLEEENRNLNLSYIEMQSMDKLISGAKSLSLVPVDNVETIAAETVAVNR